MKLQTVSRTLEDPRSLGPFVAIRNQREYDVAASRLAALVDEIGDHPENPRYRLIETLSVLIEAFDSEHNELPAAPGVEVLRFLVEAHGLSQGDLPEIGSQGVVSEVLSGKRELNLRQIRAVSKRFGVSPAAFIGS